MLSTQRAPWLLLFAVAVLLDVGALLLQHVLKVEPCNECIYIRAAVLGMGLAGLLGAMAPAWMAVRLVALTLWGAALAWGLYRAHLLLDLERQVREGLASSCARFKGFVSWLPLDQWLPEMFEPRASCGDVSWTFLGQSVTSLVWIAMWLLATAAMLVLVAQFKRSKPWR